MVDQDPEQHASTTIDDGFDEDPRIEQLESTHEVPEELHDKTQTSLAITTKTGLDPTTMHPEFNDENVRPSSSYTNHSSHFEYENAEDAALVARNIATRVKGATVESKSPSATRHLLARATPSVAPDRPPEFVYKQAVKPSVKFSRPRDTHGVPLPTAEVVNAQSQPRLGSFDAAIQSAQGSVQTGFPTVTQGHGLQQQVSPAVIVNASAENRTKRNSKKKSKQRPKIPPTTTAQTNITRGRMEPSAHDHQQPSPDLTASNHADGPQSLVSSQCPSPQQNGAAVLSNEIVARDVQADPDPSFQVTAIPYAAQEDDRPTPIAHMVNHGDDQTAHDAFAAQDSSGIHRHSFDLPFDHKQHHQRTDSHTNNPRHDDRNTADRSHSLDPAPQHSARLEHVHHHHPVSNHRLKSKNKGRKPVPAHDPDSDSDVNDYLQIAAFKAREKRMKLRSHFQTERGRLQGELQKCTEDMQGLQKQLSAAHDQNRGLSTITEEQSQKLKKWQIGLGRIQKFTAGLGYDVDTLKSNGTAIRLSIEEIAQESVDQKAERSEMLQSLSDCIRKSSEIRGQALSSLREAQIQIEQYCGRIEYLERDLSERTGLLTEERDRRTQLEKQMSAAASAEKGLQRLLKANHDAALDKLLVIQATLEEHQDQTKVAERVELAIAAVQGLNTQESSNSDDLISIKAIVDSLSESMTRLLEHSRKSTQAEPTSPESILAAMDKGLRDLTTSVDQRELLMQQNATSRETIAGLSEQIRACDVRMADAQLQLEVVRTNELQLKDQNLSLQTKLTTLQSKCLLESEVQSQLHEAKAQLDHKTLSLESTKAELDKQAEDLRSVHAENVKLHTQSEALQERIQQLDTQSSSLGPQREESERVHAQEMRDMRAELELQEASFRAQRLAAKDNDIRKIATQRDSLSKTIQSLTEELADTAAKLDECQHAQIYADSNKDREIRELKQLASANESEIELLRNSVKVFEASVEGDKALKEQLVAVSRQCALESRKLQEKTDEHAAALERVHDLDRDLNQAHAHIKTAEISFRSERSEHEAGLEQLRESCRQMVNNEEAKLQKKIDALQQRLAEAHDEIQEKCTAEEKFKSDLEASWEIEHEAYQEQVGRVAQEAVEASTQRDDALRKVVLLRIEMENSTTERLRALQEQLEQSEQRTLAAEMQLQEMSKRPQQHSSDDLSTQHADSRITPGVASDKIEPPRPRKKVDRSAGMLIDPGPIPTPEVLRPESRGQSSGMPMTLGSPDPPFEDLQAVTICGSLADANQDGDDLHQITATGIHTSFAFLSEQNDIPNATSQIVQETQGEIVPSTASSTASTGPRLNSSASVFSVRPMRDIMSGGPLRGRNAGPSSSGERPDVEVQASLSDTFFSYEESQNIIERPYDTAATQYSQPLSDQDKYTFHKEFPQPNSASRRSSVKNPTPSGSRSGILGSAAEVSGSVRYHTPGPRDANKTLPSRINTMSHMASNASSSPDFMKNYGEYNEYGTGSQTYAGHGPAFEKRYTPTASISQTVDPRLIGREAAQSAIAKRKPSNQLVEGYEQERKKRLGQTNASTPVGTHRYPLRASTGRLDSPIDGPEPPGGTQYGSSNSAAHLRMSTLGGGGTARNTRKKKLASSDELARRFDAVLSRH